ncbi:MAG TPA: hypothetical protein VNO70_12855 [Blastocatellia bacterium]|nr:hypothetical protein [Blastocatellia bacterium]
MFSVTASVPAQSGNPGEIVFEYDFKKKRQGWKGGFADYPVDGGADYELVFKRKSLPENLNENRKALFLAGDNHSDDLFMFVKRRLAGLKPNTTYEARFAIEIATIAPTNAVGVGGSPGESVFLKAGGSTAEPLIAESDGHFRIMNLDKGNQAQGGENAVVLGTIGNSCDRAAGCNDPQWEFKSFHNHEHPVSITTDNGGNLWLLVGTDSGFEGKTEIFISRIKVTLLEAS